MRSAVTGKIQDDNSNTTLCLATSDRLGADFLITVYFIHYISFYSTKHVFTKFYVIDLYIGANFISMVAEFLNCIHQAEPAELVK